MCFLHSVRVFSPLQIKEAIGDSTIDEEYGWKETSVCVFDKTVKAPESTLQDEVKVYDAKRFLEAADIYLRISDVMQCAEKL